MAGDGGSCGGCCTSSPNQNTRMKALPSEIKVLFVCFAFVKLFCYVSRLMPMIETNFCFLGRGRGGGGGSLGVRGGISLRLTGTQKGSTRFDGLSCQDEAEVLSQGSARFPAHRTAALIGSLSCC